MKQEIIKRLISDRKGKSYLSNELFLRCIGKKHRGRDITIHAVINWFHMRNENETLEPIYIELLEEKEPELFIFSTYEPA